MYFLHYRDPIATEKIVYDISIYDIESKMKIQNTINVKLFEYDSNENVYEHVEQPNICNDKSTFHMQKVLSFVTYHRVRNVY